MRRISASPRYVPDMVSLEGETRILGKRENRGILRMGDRISIFDSNWIWGHRRWRGGTEILETANLGKHLEWRDWDET